jgi:hypothetical protein
MNNSGAAHVQCTCAISNPLPCVSNEQVGHSVTGARKGLLGILEFVRNEEGEREFGSIGLLRELL